MSLVQQKAASSNIKQQGVPTNIKVHTFYIHYGPSFTAGYAFNHMIFCKSSRADRPDCVWSTEILIDMIYYIALH